MQPNGISDLITKTILQKSGVKDSNVSNVSIREIGEALNTAIKQIAEGEEVEKAADIFKKLIKSNGESQNPFVGLKDIGLDMKSIIDAYRDILESTQKMLQEERERRLEEKKEISEESQKQKVEEMNATAKLIDSMIDLQTKTFTQQIELLKTLSEQIKSRQGEEPVKEDAVTQKLKEKVLDILDKSMFPANPQDKSGTHTITQVKEMLEVVQGLRSMFAPNTEGSNRLSNLEAGLQIELQKMKNELETKKLEFEDKWKTKELEEKYKAQEKRWEVLNNIVVELSKLVPIATESFRSGKTSSGVPAMEKRTICPQCGEDFSIIGAVGQCPRCGVQVSVAPQSNSTPLGLQNFIAPDQGIRGVEV